MNCGRVWFIGDIYVVLLIRVSFMWSSSCDVWFWYRNRVHCCSSLAKLGECFCKVRVAVSSNKEMRSFWRFSVQTGCPDHSCMSLLVHCLLQAAEARRDESVPRLSIRYLSEWLSLLYG